VLLSSRRKTDELAVLPKAAALSQRLLVPVLVVLGVSFLVTCRWVPYSWQPRRS
jgi:hypothetical protein